MATRALLMCFVLLLPVAAVAGEFEDDTYARVLERFVGEDGRVDYAALAADREDLDAYIASIAGADPVGFDKLDDAHRLAGWINAYNALTLGLIIDHYPIAPTDAYPGGSIRQIDGAWTDVTHTVVGADITLDQIEHQTIRLFFDEPRIHMALVCAAISCPPLRREPYTGAQLEEQLEEQSRIFVTDPRHLRIDRDKQVLWLSTLFSWFASDFVRRYGDGPGAIKDDGNRAVVAFVSRFLPGDDRAWLATGDYRILYFEYDWNLNDRPQ